MGAPVLNNEVVAPVLNNKVVVPVMALELEAIATVPWQHIDSTVNNVQMILPQKENKLGIGHLVPGKYIKNYADKV